MRIRLTKIQLIAEFVIDSADDQPLEPGAYGPVNLTPKDWNDLDLIARIQNEIEKNG